jgi:hypothetical protein
MCSLYEYAFLSDLDLLQIQISLFISSYPSCDRNEHQKFITSINIQ